MRRPRKRTLLILAAAALLVPAFLLSLLGLKLLRDFSAITRQFQSEYGNYVAQIATRSVEDAFWEQEQLNMVSARLDPPRNPAEVANFLKDLLKENPHYLQAFFVVPEGLVQYWQTDPERTKPFRPLPAWILDPIRATLRTDTGMPSGLNQLASPDSLPPVQVTYFTLHADAGELLGAVGVVWDLDFIKRNAAFFERNLALRVAQRADIFRGAIFRSPVAISILDETGHAFYSTAPRTGSGFIARLPFQRVLTFYTVGVELSDNRFDSWVHSVVRTSVALILSMFLVIVLAVVFSLRFVFHEIELAELKSTLVSNVSHELKTPLALIRLFSETLQMGRAESPEKEKEFLRIIHKESERLTHLIDNVLDLGRIEQDRKTYSMRPTDLLEVVNETVEAYRFQLQQQGFTLVTDLEPGLPPVSADPDALTQALLNLMDNAIKYSPREKHLKVALGREDGQAVISVQDRGIGIPPREQRRIFDMFYRAERGLVHSVKGSGLGLSLVRHIVEAHGGAIRVESRPGYGSTFSITLPLDGEAASGEEGPES